MVNFCVIFDIDGTLCDTNAVDDHCYRCAAAAALGIPAAQVDWTGVDEITDSAIARCLWLRHRTRAPNPDEIKAFQFDPQLHPTVPTIIENHERHYLSYPRKAPAL